MSQKPFSFLGLPKELRLMVYEFIPEMTVIRMPIDHSSPVKLWDHWVFRWKAPAWYWHYRTCNMAILRTCKRIYHEAQSTIIRVLWGPADEPYWHFSSHGFSIVEMMYELAGDRLCCDKHNVRKVKEIIIRRTEGLRKTPWPPSKMNTTRIDYQPLPLIGRSENELFDLGDDIAALQLLSSRPEFSINTLGGEQSMLGDDEIVKSHFEAYRARSYAIFLQLSLDFMAGKGTAATEMHWPSFYRLLERRSTPRSPLLYCNILSWELTKEALSLAKKLVIMEFILGLLFLTVRYCWKSNCN